MLHIATQNLKGALSYPERAEALLGSIDEQSETARADVVFYSEAYDEAVDPKYGGVMRNDLRRRFRKLGYESLDFAYDDTDKRKDRNGGWLIVDREACDGRVKGEYHNLQRRMGALAFVTDPETGETVWVMGAHLDDRSRESRRVMADAVGWALNRARNEAGERMVLAGVVNSTEQDDPHAEGLRRLGSLRRSRVARGLWDAVAAKPGTAPERGFRRKLRLAAGAIDMANDGVADKLRKIGLVSVDPAHTPTVRGGGHALRLGDVRYTQDTLAVVEQGVESPAPGVEAAKDNHVHAGAKVWATLQVA